jgi:aldehyde dehydrogenase (NAD+)
MIAKGIDEGAKLLVGGLGRPAGFSQGWFAQPTIFSAVRSDMAIAREEIFGPVLAILAYDSIDEAVAIANDTVYGLGAHVQGTDLDTVRAVAARIESGQVHLNYPAWDPQAPFGGYKQSGNGREYGVEGMEEYLEIKSILGYYA